MRSSRAPTARCFLFVILATLAYAAPGDEANVPETENSDNITGTTDGLVDTDRITVQRNSVQNSSEGASSLNSGNATMGEASAASGSHWWEGDETQGNGTSSLSDPTCQRDCDSSQTPGSMAVHDDKQILLDWKAMLPEGECLGCQNGPVFRNWTKETRVCDWTALVAVPGYSEPVERGVTRCSTSKQKVRHLVLDNMNLAGKLPVGFTGLDEMSDLGLSDNSFTGHLPEEWSQLGSRARDVEIDISRNQVSGILPPSWSQNAKLRTISATDNLLTGPLPSQWGNFQHIVRLVLDNNRISGALPSTWSKLSSLKRIRLEDNDISGSLPLEWSTMTSLSRLELANNELTGPIPAEWSTMTELTQLILRDNELSGTIPRELMKLASVPPMLLAFDVSENRLQVNADQFPEAWDISPQRDESFKDPAISALLKWVDTLPPGNCLGCKGGPVLANFTKSRNVCDWNGWVILPGKGRRLRGVMKCEISTQQIEELSLADMEIGGPLPIGLRHQEHLKRLDLSDNSFSGTVPGEWSTIGLLSDTLSLQIDRNLLRGTLPLSWRNHPSMQKFWARNNKLSGSLPIEWSEMGQLKELYLSRNKFTGTLPASWSEVEDMQILKVTDNRLSGKLPPEWSAWTGLLDMDLKKNKLESSIPDEWSLFTGADLDLSKNNLDSAPFWTPALWKVDSRVDSQSPDVAPKDNSDSSNAVPTSQGRQPILKAEENTAGVSNTLNGKALSDSQSSDSEINGMMFIIIGICIGVLAILLLAGSCLLVMSRRRNSKSPPRMHQDSAAPENTYSGSISLSSILLEQQDCETPIDGTYRAPPITIMEE